MVIRGKKREANKQKEFKREKNNINHYNKATNPILQIIIH